LRKVMTKSVMILHDSSLTIWKADINSNQSKLSN